MDQAKIRLSPEEKELVTNAGWILTKNAIMQKAKYLFEAVQHDQQSFLNQHSMLPGEITSIPPKISRGENYRGLPWLMLDYPRYFEKGNTFAIRTMFWWGRFFSSTLHLSGVNKQLYGEKLLARAVADREHWFLCVSDDQWQHHMEEDNYRLIRDMAGGEVRSLAAGRDFLKIATTFPIADWEEVGEHLSESFKKLVSWVAD